jgi:hypothetical protein
MIRAEHQSRKLRCDVNYIASHRIASHRIASHRSASHLISSHRIPYRIASHRIASHRIASQRIASHRITSHRTTAPQLAGSYCLTLHFNTKIVPDVFYKNINRALRLTASH